MDALNLHSGPVNCSWSTETESWTLYLYSAGDAEPGWRSAAKQILQNYKISFHRKDKPELIFMIKIV